jgi:hypothetical protein
MSIHGPANNTRRVFCFSTLFALMTFGLGAATAGAASPPPVKLVLREQISHEFEYPEGIDGTQGNDVYVADRGNHRIQELEADGKFVLMFGAEVDATSKGDICTAASKDTCKAGVQGSDPGNIDEAQSVTVAPESLGGDIYVAELVPGANGLGMRVQKFTPTGEFLLEIGKDVNNAGGNLCTAAELAKCQGPAPSTAAEHGSFDFESNAGNVLAVGGPAELLYVGEGERVQEFTTAGAWKGEIQLAALAAPGASVQALALEQTTGNLYLSYGNGSLKREGTIHEFASTGLEVGHFAVLPKSGDGVLVDGLALDGEGRLAVVAAEESVVGQQPGQFGRLYEAASGHPITEFSVPQNADVVGIGFDGAGELFAAASVARRVLRYEPVDVAELRVVAQKCEPGAEHGTDATIDCALNGEANPESVADTEVWFQWGETCASLAFATPRQLLPEESKLLPVQAAIEGLKPNGQEFCYRLDGYDQNVKEPEPPLTSSDPETISFSTPIVPAQIVGLPSVSHVRDSAAVMSAELNPENAQTEAYIEYSPEQGALEGCPHGVRQAAKEGSACPGVAVTEAAKSSLYGETGVSVEASGLQPDTAYEYRLSAEDESNNGSERLTTIGSAGTFTTALGPVVSVSTGTAGGVDATEAVVSGVVDGGGQPARYAIELGVYDGSQTQYATVFSGSTTGEHPEEEAIQLSGLQPATTYAYRFAISSGYVQNEEHTLYATPVTFLTQGVPALLTPPTVLPQLPTPSIPFPVEKAKSKTPTRAQELAAALKACHAKPRSHRAACERTARKKYPTTKAKAKKQKRKT